MSVRELGWDEAQKVWGEWFARHGFDGVQMLWGVYYLRRREVDEYIWLTDEDVAPSKLAWLIQQGFAKGVRLAESNPSSIPMYPEFPMVRCDQCRKVYRLDTDRPPPLTGHCPRCGGETFSTVLTESNPSKRRLA